MDKNRLIAQTETQKSNLVTKYRVYTKEWCGKLVVTPSEHQL